MDKRLTFKNMGFGRAFLIGVLALVGYGQVALGLLSLNSESFAESTCDREIAPLFTNEYSGISSPQYRLIDNLSDWCQVWDAFFGDLSPKPPCNTELVDFSREVAVLAATGLHSSGGFPVQITCVRSGGSSSNIQVLVTESSPAPGCPVTGIPTRPATIVKVHRPVRKTIFKFETVVVDCSP